MTGKKQILKYETLRGNKNAAKLNPRNVKRTVRLTEAEDYTLYNAANTAGVKVAEYMRRKILN